MVLIELPELESTVYSALLSMGYPPEEAEVITRVMIYAELHNNNQGISKLYLSSQLSLCTHFPAQPAVLIVSHKVRRRVPM